MYEHIKKILFIIYTSLFLAFIGFLAALVLDILISIVVWDNIIMHTPMSYRFISLVLFIVGLCYSIDTAYLNNDNDKPNNKT